MAGEGEGGGEVGGGGGAAAAAVLDGHARSAVVVSLCIEIDLGRFVELFPSAVHKGNVLLLAWAYVSPNVLLGPGGADSPDPLGALTRLLGARP